ncbi:leucine-rich repeat domain, L domain-like protein [Artemisia annua]|uniref:Leucine-rich repeat domain, L domain-like protein n=1 Tax=Artemisia annua TaxID=35608 RepID=A0A2U1Q784_ARTAN|nr:leucine-rich repeat domain, L domain-like protein [Artemisia annua]
MAIKRLGRHQENDTSINTNKKIRHTKTNPKMEDRLTNLPESLQLRILSTLKAQYVVQTSVLSKSWVPLWKSVPILRLNSYDFKKDDEFDKFVEKVISSQRDMDLDTLIYKRDGVSTALEKVIDYAFSHNVKHLDIWIDSVEDRKWPVVLHGFGDSLTCGTQGDKNCGFTKYVKKIPNNWSSSSPGPSSSGKGCYSPGPSSAGQGSSDREGKCQTCKILKMKIKILEAKLELASHLVDPSDESAIIDLFKGLDGLLLG